VNSGGGEKLGLNHKHGAPQMMPLQLVYHLWTQSIIHTIYGWRLTVHEQLLLPFLNIFLLFMKS